MLAAFRLTAMAARRLFCRRVVFSFAVAFISFGTPTSLAQPVMDNFEMGKRTTLLERSDRFETLTFFRQDTAGGGLVAVSTSMAPVLRIPPDIGRRVELRAIEARGVLLMEFAPNVSPKAILPVVDDYNERYAHAATKYVVIAGNQATGNPPLGNPIYSTGEVNNIVLNEVIVRFAKGTDPREIAKTFRKFNAKVVLSADRNVTGSYVVRFPRASGHETRELSNRLDALRHVEYAQPNFIVIDPERLPSARFLSNPLACSSRCPDAAPTVLSGDQFFSKQWHLENTGIVGKAFADTNARKAWDLTQGDASIIIAVLDDLVQVNHPDLAGKIHEPWDAFCQDGGPSSLVLADSDRHGTAAAGIAAAVTGNLQGVAGMAPNVRIMPIRTHGDSPCRIVDGLPIGNHGAIAAAIMHAVNNGADVLSMSWVLGWASKWPNGISEIESVLNNDTVASRVLVFAAGNYDGFPGREADYPASRASELDNIIPVSATDQFDALQIKSDLSDDCDWSSNFGEDTVAAPGVDLYTTDRTQEFGFCTAGEYSGYAKFSGTSAATPLVAGVAALMLSKTPALTPLQVRTQLQQSAEHPNANAEPPVRPTDATGWGLGWGRIDACRALQGGESCARPPLPNPPTNIDIQ